MCDKNIEKVRSLFPEKKLVFIAKLKKCILEVTSGKHFIRRKQLV